MDELLRITIFRGHHGFGRFFADLLQDRVGALVKKPRDITLVGVARLALLDDVGQACQGVVAVHL
jgi:hypothetical protein